ncbi:hypothetical protein [Mycobacterium scrofulaceum]|uniref:hypothetical protein n=1 Tax=Mycobacterium scrofulaceum TaxID=1783 RepID=UPI000A7F47A1|nr:hypothetical protein [Mycobacterium scrofulaceum]
MTTDQDIEQMRRRRRRQIEVVAPMVDARLKGAAQAEPNRLVGEWRGSTVVDTAPSRYGTGKPVSAAELARYKVVFAHEVDDAVFAVCRVHQTAYGTYSQGDARNSTPDTWCPGCSSDPTWPPGIVDPAVVAAEDRAREERIAKIKASRKTRITKATQIATERGVISDQQAAQLVAIWQEIRLGDPLVADPLLDGGGRNSPVRS